MGIRVECQSCQSVFTVKGEFAGRRGKCPRCQAVVQVPASTDAHPPSPLRHDLGGDTAEFVAGSTHAASAAIVPVAADQSKGTAEDVGYGLAADDLLERRALESLDKLARVTTVKPVRGQKPGADQVLQAFRGKINPVRVPLGYRVGLLLVAMLVVLLPVIYIAMIAGVGAGVWYHATHHIGIIGTIRGRGAILTVMVYVAPIITGGILLLFMLKPLFAPPGRARRERSLRPAAEPLLFAFVKKICESVGAPMPKEIQVDNQVNASAGLGRGLFSNDLVLVIGVPLVAGLTTGQFAGVLAHEFGHFTQGTAMRLTYLIRRIIAWFHRVVHDRDGWDEWLASAEDLDWRLGWILIVANGCVWLTRAILWLLEMLALACCGLLLRQMEYHADMHEIRLAGSKNFEATMRRISVFGGVFNSTLNQIASTAPAAMVSDLPQLASMVMEITRPELIRKVEKRLMSEKTQWHHTHPAPADRIAVALAEQDAGQFDFDRGADCLFKDFDALARNVTLDLYQGALGMKLKADKLMPPEAYLAKFMAAEHLPPHPASEAKPQ